ncbi:MAG: hypothetical protein C4574_03200 [Candidatus Latescibacterota bacterium]|jgi:hypothetical protein|nr:MAG: hypothetical protein C4574_03200 [Candidatus Latescibacterota bacterium]
MRRLASDAIMESRNGIRARRRALRVTLAVGAALAAVAGLCAMQADAGAVSVTLEAENFSRCHDVDFDPIRKVDTRLHGLGAPGEWVEYDFSMSSFGTYAATLVCWGEIGVTYTMHLSYSDLEDTGLQTIAFTFAGTGDYTVCGRVINAAGSSPLLIYGSSCTLRLEYVSGSPIAGAFWADYLKLDSVIAAECFTWGMIKSLYR